MNDRSMTPSTVLPGELFDIEELERELRASEAQGDALQARVQRLQADSERLREEAEMAADLADFFEQEFNDWVEAHEAHLAAVEAKKVA